MWLLIALLTAEFLLMAGVSAYLIIQLIVSTPVSVASGIAVFVLTLVATVWLAYIVVGALRGRAWIRGAAIVWQVMQFAIGIGCFQGLTATPAVGWALIVPAVVVVLLLLSRPVVRATAHRG
ncbi:hypothetical protein AS850_09915 [Frondihabitans sp. 762G35]|nr:hypothetical protein AS850_09915 [Frondihabitans sp. 762G35]